MFKISGPTSLATALNAAVTYGPLLILKASRNMTIKCIISDSYR